MRSPSSSRFCKLHKRSNLGDDPGLQEEDGLHSLSALGHRRQISLRSSNKVNYSKIQGSPDNMTPLEIGKSVTQIDCHINRSFLVREERPFWNQKKMSYKAIFILSGKLCTALRNHEFDLTAWAYLQEQEASDHQDMQQHWQPHTRALMLRGSPKKICPVNRLVETKLNFNEPVGLGCENSTVRFNRWFNW